MLSGDCSVQSVDLLAMACQKLALTRVPACVKDSELRYVAVSPAFAALYGCPADAFKGRTDEELLDGWKDETRDSIERRAIVFGQDGTAEAALGKAGVTHRLQVEQFICDRGDIFIFERCDEVEPAVPVPATRLAQNAVADDDDRNFLSLIESALTHLDAGILILNPRDIVVYANDTMKNMHRRFMGTIQVGESLAKALGRAAANGIAPGVDCADEKACADWVEGRLAGYRVAHFEDVFETSDGRFLRMVNRRLPNGYMVGLHLDITESKEREALLIRQKEEVSLYKAILDALPVPVFARDENHVMAYANEVELGMGLAGKRGAETVGHDETAVFGDEAEAYFEENERVLKTGVVSEREVPMKLKNGGELPILLRVSRTRLPDGRRYVVGSLTDISALKEREIEIEQARSNAEAARQQLLDIINSIDTGIIVVRQDDLSIELANTHVLAKWKDTPLEDLIGRKFFEMMDYNDTTGRFDIGPGQLEAAKQHWSDQIKAGHVPLREVTTNDGEIYLVQGQQVAGGRLVLTYNDITQLRQQDRVIDEAHAKLAETGSLMNEALVAMAQGLVLLTDGRIRIFNEAVTRLLDLPEGMVKVGGGWQDIFTFCAARGDFGEEPNAFLEGISDRARRREVIDTNFSIGGSRWIRLEARPTAANDVIVLLTDVSELRSRQSELERLLARAEKADRAKSDFLAGVSHEIRTPMNGVLSMAELLARSNLDSRQKTYVDAIGKSAKALMTVINDILDFSRLESGSLELRPVNFNPLESVDDVVALFAVKAEEKGLDLVVTASPDTPHRVHGDALRFRQMVFNLVNNAVRFTERGHVEVRLSNGEPIDGRSTLKLEIEDTGIGIREDRLKTIFEKFARASISNGTHNEGLGLGLATAESLVRLFGGKIEATSEMGRGSTFTLKLPLATVEPASGSGGLQYSKPGEAHVVVVDAVAVRRESMVATLSGWGFDAIGAESGDEAIAIIEAAKAADIAIDAAIVSGGLPERGAARFTESLRSCERLSGVQVILVTSALPEALHMSSEIAAEAQLQRPVRSSLLFGTLCDLLAGKRQRAPAQSASPAAKAEPASAGPVEILVAEDNEINIMVYEQILSQMGCSYRIARDGEMAVKMWAQLRPQVVVMDVAMPVMDGLAATAAIREAEARCGLDRTPIIGATAHSLDTDRNACLDAGMDDYLAKPISPERLSSKIDTWRAIVKGEASIPKDFIQSA